MAHVNCIVMGRSLPSETGQVDLEVRCGSCPTVFSARLWSMHGSGKKCPGCGAVNTMPRRGAAKPVAATVEYPAPADGVRSRYDPARHNPTGIFRGGR